MATKRQELVDGCFARARDDEPLFVLRATDELAPELVREWARQYRAQKAADPPTQRAEHERREAKYREALQLATEMERWYWQHSYLPHRP